MNAAHDIKILEYWICIYSLEKRRKKYFGKKTKQKQNKTQFLMVKSQLMVYQNE